MSEENLIQQAIRAYFSEVSSITDKITELKQGIDKNIYNQIAKTALYALLEQLATSRYGLVEPRSSTRFKKLLRNYSNQKDDLEKLILSFCINGITLIKKNQKNIKKQLKKFTRKLKMIS